MGEKPWHIYIALFSFYLIYSIFNFLFFIAVLYLYEEPPVPVLNAQKELGIWFGSGSFPSLKIRHGSSPVLGNLD